MKNNISSFFESQKFKDMLSQYEEARENNQHIYFDSDQLGDICEYYLIKGKYKQAHEAVDYTLKLHPHTQEATVIKIHIFIEENKLEEANELLDQVYDPNDYDLQLVKGELLLAKEKNEEVEELFKLLIEREPDNKDCYIDIAYLYYDYTCFEEAIKWFKLGHEIYPDDAEIMEGLAECYFEMSEAEQSITYYNKLLDTNPYSTVYWNDLAKIYITIRDFNKAIEACEFTLAIDNQDKQGLLLMGHCYAGLENYEKAEEYYVACGDIAEESSTVNYYLGICYAAMGKYREALDIFEKKVEESEEYFLHSFEVYSCMSNCYCELGDKEKAIQYIDKAIGMDPGYTEMYIIKIKELIRLGYYPEAVELSLETADIFKKDVSVVMDIGLILTELKEMDKAIQVFELLKERFELAYHIFMTYIYHVTDKPENFEEHMQAIQQYNSEDFMTRLSNITEDENIMLMRDILLEVYKEKKSSKL